MREFGTPLPKRRGCILKRMPFSSCTLIICLSYVFFGVGYSIFNRRYQ